MSVSSVGKTIRLILACLISWIVTILLLIPCSIILILLALYKGLVNLIVKCFHPNWIPLNGIDIGHAGTGLIGTSTSHDDDNLDGTYLSNIGFYAVVDGNLTLDDLKELVQTKILQNYPLYQKMFKIPIKFMFHYYWREAIPIDQINLNELVIENSSNNNKTNLNEFLAKFIHTPYKVGDPLWQICLYKDDEFYKNNKSIIIFKMSHCIGDGFAIGALGFTFSGAQSRLSTASVTFKVPDRCLNKKVIVDFVKSEILSPIMWPLSTYHLIRNCSFKSGPIDQRNTGKDYLITNVCLNLKLVKEIRRKLNCHFSDVIAGLMGGMVYKLYLRIMKDTNGTAKMPKYFTMTCPIGLPRIGTRPIKNKMAIIVYKVPLIGNSLDRIKSLSKQSKQYQNYRLDKVTKHLISIPYLIPSFLFKLMNRGNSEPYVGISVLPMLTNLGQVAEMPVEALVTYAGVLNDKAYLMCLAQSVKDDNIIITFTGNQNVFGNQEEFEKFAMLANDELLNSHKACQEEKIPRKDEGKLLIV